MKRKFLNFVFISLFIIQCGVSQNFLNNSNIEQELKQYRHEILHDKQLKSALGLGASIDLGTQSNGSLRVYATVAVLQDVGIGGDFHALIGAQSLLEIYRGGLGTSVLDTEKSKFVFEIRNNAMLLIGFDDDQRISGKPAFVNLATNKSPLFDPLDYSVSFGTTFINGLNHSRNQRVGTMSLSVFGGRVAYYNDGPPFSALGLGDKYDRYWSGGGVLGFYYRDNESIITDIAIRFDNYTGYQSNLYETVDLLKLDNIAYKKKKQQFFNQSRIQYQLGIKNQFILHYSYYQPYYWDIQKWIHYNMSHNPFHPRPKSRRKTIGADYNHINLDL